ncbi:MEDS domain-containing protein [Bacillus thermotolerans]|uniref:MEDS domain-containing protein n=1 Tax=Bacillus thermotolerans TaxID=1221996 RepID=UPI000582DF61|nr:MEDS domain-containing protein [Bacillus thermotolerans]KKB33302.1 hypothetical protein QY97_03568 [Bacillus thermotolerans]
MLYCFDHTEQYLDNAISYILSGIEQGEHVIFIESERNILLLSKRLECLLTPDQLGRIHYHNNFEFYWSTGDSHTASIVSYFKDILEPFLSENVPVRTWAHVEWGQETNIEEKIIGFEQVADENVRAMNMLSVRAYHSARLTDSLKESLLLYHSHLITDGHIEALSQQQSPAE